MHLTTIVLASVAALGYSSPFREQRSISDFCDRHASLYERYCAGRLSDFDASSRSKLERFCAEFEDSCSTPNEYQANLVVPPPLPKSSSINFDLPIPAKKTKVVPGKFAHGLTPELVATCTPECTEPHCTTACKCANTHPKVHGMCNPPATADLVDVCARWYAKCTLFQPLAYY
ncbi:hypothetical protein PRIPAC_92674 [Pristionchus pacificus]|uniref:Uncharacterized protein n=1 Tax=Pristionchus pacificus TaxID=54126 RepID=A0A2A6CE86_PRIPA|nr:hypothetical protein PRIPAC_92674 [Pristionchus pacificus]|eukprot:PDM76321.1 hypothetical protein PRIPAC_39925 [Pristionchus pacificus]